MTKKKLRNIKLSNQDKKNFIKYVKADLGTEEEKQSFIEKDFQRLVDELAESYEKQSGKKLSDDDVALIREKFFAEHKKVTIDIFQWEQQKEETK